MKNSIVICTIILSCPSRSQRNKAKKADKGNSPDDFISPEHRGLWNRQVTDVRYKPFKPFKYTSKGLMPDTLSSPFDRIGKDRAELEATHLSDNNPFAGRLTLPGQLSDKVNRSDRFPIRMTPLIRPTSSSTTKTTRPKLPPPRQPPTTTSSTTTTTTQTTTTITTTSTVADKRKNKQISKKKDKTSKKQRKAQQRKERRNKLKNTLRTLARSSTGQGKGAKQKIDDGRRVPLSPLARALAGTSLGTTPIETLESSHVFKNHIVHIRKKTYMEARKNVTEFGENLFTRSGTMHTTQREENIYCASSFESMGKDLKGVKCPPGQVWAFNKNPRCSLSFSDAVYENTSPDCPYPSSVTSEYACICPCKRQYLLTFMVDFDIKLDDGSDANLNTECQLCRSEKQILLHGLNLSPMDEKKCERTVRRATKDWLNRYKYQILGD